jgi:hypothetical protein
MKIINYLVYCDTCGFDGAYPIMIATQSQERARRVAERHAILKDGHKVRTETLEVNA